MGHGLATNRFSSFFFSFYFSFLFSIHSGKYICMGTSRGRNEHEKKDGSGLWASCLFSTSWHTPFVLWRRVAEFMIWIIQYAYLPSRGEVRRGRMDKTCAYGEEIIIMVLLRHLVSRGRRRGESADSRLGSILLAHHFLISVFQLKKTVASRIMIQRDSLYTTSLHERNRAEKSSPARKSNYRNDTTCLTEKQKTRQKYRPLQRRAHRF
jgi:hypothetical protein